MLQMAAILDAILDFDPYRVANPGTPIFYFYLAQMEHPCKISDFNHSGNDFDP